MRRAFTLIELMITILLTLIFLTFVFRFYTNVLLEVRYLEAKDSLAYNAFRTAEIIKNGVYSGSKHIRGVVTLDSLTSSTEFKTKDGNITKIIQNSEGIEMIGETSSYLLSDANVSNFTITHVAGALYLVEFNISKESILKYGDFLDPKYDISYQRLVYTK